MSVPTDCPQRDERLGWTGDAQVFAPTASFLYDSETFWEQWLGDLAADQGESGAVPHIVPAIPLGHAGAAGWGDAAVVVPWSTYLAYGDDHVLRQALPSMRAWVDFVWSRLGDDHRWSRDFQFGDWLDPDAPTEEPWRAKAKFDLVASAYAAHTTALLARAAEVLGEFGVADTYADRAATLRAAWWRSFEAAATTTQTGAALAIMFDLAPDEEARLALGEALAMRVHDADDHLATGFLGTPVLLPALTATGHLDLAYTVLLQRTCPSWLYTVLAGATTIWERWDALPPDGSVPLEALGAGSGSSMVSFNHYAYGAVAEWLHTAVAGLRPDPDDPGYHHLIIEPRPGGGITSASASLQTRFGRASVAWELGDRGLHVEVEVPPNTFATVTLPGRPPDRVRLREPLLRRLTQESRDDGARTSRCHRRSRAGRRDRRPRTDGGGIVRTGCRRGRERSTTTLILHLVQGPDLFGPDGLHGRSVPPLTWCGVALSRRTRPIAAARHRDPTLRRGSRP